MNRSSPDTAGAPPSRMIAAARNTPTGHPSVRPDDLERLAQG